MMLQFLIIFGVSVLALLVVRAMDIECEQPPRPVRRPAPDRSFPPYAAMREVH